MFEKINKILNTIRMKQNAIECDLERYTPILNQIGKLNFSVYSDLELKELSNALKARVRTGTSADEVLVTSFALVREAAGRVLGLYPYDEQVLGALALHQGRIIEMQTGEGKTLTAVMPAYLNALGGNGVHILTVNDYLAQRDAAWMGPLFDFLGLSAGFIKEGMETRERQIAYARDITYVTAKEAGFDYLRDFLCYDKHLLLHRGFNYAIADEADSILIDESRIPLVIAGKTDDKMGNASKLIEVIRRLRLGLDYEIDEKEGNVFFTDLGLSRAEQLLCCGNLYASSNLELLTGLNCALSAEVQLKRDRDYIVRNGRIELVDEFTGRVALKRNWPDKLQEAVEAKEGLSVGSKGQILASIPLQYFMSLYSKVSGMTGTAKTAAPEFKAFYDLEVQIIPTHKPCIRKDHPDLVFTHKEAKYAQMTADIKRIHQTGQPVLIGTANIEESERVAAKLKAAGMDCVVLNAKNDEMEANIVARAGESGRITVSTNMAGRGVDIKLGGEDEADHERVVSLGGLFVIGANRYESHRIDEQLRGRSGRQGDPGESRFYVSLEDDLVCKFQVANLLKSIPQKQQQPLSDPAVSEAVYIGQRFAEGYNSDVRRQLWKYTYIVEQQRRIIFKKRQDVLRDKVNMTLIAGRAPYFYNEMLKAADPEILAKAEKHITLYILNKGWAEYLEFISYQREGIHLMAIGRKDPFTEFNRIAVEAFDNMLISMEDEIISTFELLEFTKDGFDFEKAGIKGPSSTWTYLINENPEQFSRLPALVKASSNMIRGTVFSVQSVLNRLIRKGK